MVVSRRSVVTRPLEDGDAAASPEGVTELVRAWTRGDRNAGEELVPLVYQDLRALAASYLADERPNHTLQPTALVHEAFLRLAQLRRLEWRNRGHFLAMAARLMRRVLVEHARRRSRVKRGGGAVRIPFEETLGIPSGRPARVLALDDALRGLESFDPLKASILELRFFGGLSVAETAEALSCSTATIHRHSHLAKAWLLRELVTSAPARP